MAAKGAALAERHPPDPLNITLPAEPANLAHSRNRLREWLAATGLDAQSCSDVLLAVGEATANATEHAVVGAPGLVEITVDAHFSGDRLRISVSDTGRWKPSAQSAGPRGHGILLINALVDSVEMQTGPAGTTVTMVKELAR
ncbi:MAG: ATP-binding protein [Mycobacterium sp.]